MHSDHVPEEVQATAEKALETYFAFDNLEFGQPIHLSDVYRVLQDVTGVVAVVINCLQFKEATTESVQAHLPIDPGELAVIAQPATDAVVNARVAQR